MGTQGTWLPCGMFCHRDASLRIAQGDSTRKDFPEKLTSLLSLKNWTESRQERHSTSEWEEHEQTHVSGWVRACLWTSLSLWMRRSESDGQEMLRQLQRPRFLPFPSSPELISRSAFRSLALPVINCKTWASLLASRNLFPDLQTRNGTTDASESLCQPNEMGFAKHLARTQFLPVLNTGSRRWSGGGWQGWSEVDVGWITADSTHVLAEETALAKAWRVKGCGTIRDYYVPNYFAVLGARAGLSSPKSRPWDLGAHDLFGRWFQSRRGSMGKVRQGGEKIRWGASVGFSSLETLSNSRNCISESSYLRMGSHQFPWWLKVAFEVVGTCLSLPCS